jgi:hypothetical protein
MSNVEEVAAMMDAADKQVEKKDERQARREARRASRESGKDPLIAREIQELKDCYKDLATRVNECEIDIEDILEQLKETPATDTVTTQDIEKVSNLFLEVVRGKKAKKQKS